MFSKLLVHVCIYSEKGLKKYDYGNGRREGAGNRHGADDAKCGDGD